MGGHALKSVQVKRVTTSELVSIFNELSRTLLKYFDAVELPYLLPTKLDHGDVDILVSSSTEKKLPFDPLVVFGAKEYFPNGSVHSFDYRQAQIDIILCLNLPLSKFFMSYGDFGMIFGFLLKRWRLKFTCNGFFYTLQYENQTEYILLTTDPKELCQFIGIDYETWKKGFSDENKVFEFLLTCKYFDPKFYSQELLKSLENHDHKRRVNTRPMFNNFMLVFQDSRKSPVDLVASFEEGLSVSESKPPSLDELALEYFGIADQVRSIINTKETNIKLRKKLNGKLIEKVLDLPSGPIFSTLISSMKESYGIDRIIAMDDDELKKLLVEKYEKVKVNI